MSSYGSSLAGGLSHRRHSKEATSVRHARLSKSRDEPGFISRARLILRGGILAKGHWTSSLHRGLTPEEMHTVLLQLATEQNSDSPVAARFQSNPDKVLQLAPPESLAGSVSTGGILYRFHDRPTMMRYPRPLRLNSTQTAAITTELERLARIGAIEPAPTHDGHKALDPTSAPWERRPMAPGQWPREQQIPVLSLPRQAAYDRQQRLIQFDRRRRGLPYRDFESAIFTVPKGDGGMRLCTDYRALNKFQVKSKFQLDGTKAISQLIQPGDYGALVDMKDCYIEFGLHPAHRRHCRFRDPRLRRWQWRTMSFGTSEAPHLCTRTLRPFIKILKGLGIRCSIYLDDLLVLSQDPHSLAVSMGVAIELLQLELGLQLKLSKCNFAPSRSFTALGIIWDTAKMKCFVPSKRLKNIKSSATRLLNRAGAGAKAGVFQAAKSRPVRTRDLARLVGQCISTSIAIHPARRRLLYIQQLLGKSVRRQGWEGEIRLTPESVTAIRWWTTQSPWEANGHDIAPLPRPIQGCVTSDAATHNAGWGGTLVMGGRKWTTRGFFEPAERSLYINNLELLGNRKTVENLLPLALPPEKWHLVHLQCELDNVAAIKYGKVGVSRSMGMSILGADYFDWRARHNLSVGFQFLAGVENIESDALSRVEMSHREWKLHPDLFRRICAAFGLHVQVDLFASRSNRQVPRFYSFEHDSASLGTNCLQFPWGQLGTLYAYPPPILAARVLQKLRMDRVQNAIVMLPAWLAQNWWPTMVGMLTSPPLILPNEAWITQDQWDRPTWEGKWYMIAAPLSGNLPYAKESRRRFSNAAGRRLRTVTYASMTRILKGSQPGGNNISEMADSVRTAFERAN